MFNLERFKEDCLDALKKKSPHGAVKEVVARAVAEPGGVLKALGEHGDFFAVPRVNGIRRH